MAAVATAISAATAQVALQAQPSPPRVEVNEYPGEGHSLAGAEANAHAVQSAVAFLREHLTK